MNNILCIIIYTFLSIFLCSCGNNPQLEETNLGLGRTNRAIGINIDALGIDLNDEKVFAVGYDNLLLKKVKLKNNTLGNILLSDIELDVNAVGLEVNLGTCSDRVLESGEECLIYFTFIPSIEHSYDQSESYGYSIRFYRLDLDELVNLNYSNRIILKPAHSQEDFGTALFANLSHSGEDIKIDIKNISPSSVKIIDAFFNEDLVYEIKEETCFGLILESLSSCYVIFKSDSKVYLNNYFYKFSLIYNSKKNNGEIFIKSIEP